jgi:hypothetical protein
MQILLRRWDDKLYVWKDATFNNDTYTVDGYDIRETNILAVKDGDGGKYVRCGFCNEKLDNNPEAIEKHFVEQEAQRDCLKCIHMQFNKRTNPKRTVTKGENGMYNISETYSASLNCRYSYLDPNSEAGKEQCVYNQHRAHGVKPIGGLLMHHPDLFEKQITVEALKAKGYEFVRRYDGYFMYDMKLRNSLFAHVNECGIVDHFSASYRYETRSFHYSATQGKLFYEGNGKYVEGQPWNWSDTKYNSVKKKIEALYKEGKTK